MSGVIVFGHGQWMKHMVVIDSLLLGSNGKKE